MLQHFHRQARDELNARDVARGLPKSLACGKWIDRGNDKVFAVDPLLSRIKHSGAEFGKLRKAMWEAFCSEPRDPAIELAKLGETPSPDETPRTHIAGLAPTIQEAIAQGIAAGLAAGLSTGHAEPARRQKNKQPVEAHNAT
jgi:hypothetical protein